MTGPLGVTEYRQFVQLQRQSKAMITCPLRIALGNVMGPFTATWGAKLWRL